MLNTALKSFVRGDFARREDGSVAVETVIMLPMIFWVYLSLFSIFDTFRQYTVTQKAAYAIGDMISRENAPIDNAYFDGAHELFNYLSQSAHPSKIRITSLQWREEDDKYEVKWSKTRGGAAPMTAAGAGGMKNRLPEILNGEHIMLVETTLTYDPPFATGLEQREINNFIFTRPRYLPCILWQDTKTSPTEPVKGCALVK